VTPHPIRDTLRRLKDRGLYRTLTALGPAAGPRVACAGREVLLFASNNYLGLAGDPRVVEALCRGARAWGWGAGASRLLAGHTDAHAALEADLARFMGTEAALLFPSGYMANLGVLSALAGRSHTIVMDRACHASLYDAAALAGASLVRYPEGDAAAAAALMANPSRAILVTDTVFSMDGRRAPLADLAAAAAHEGTLLVADEAHAIGVLGASGAGLAEEVWGGPGPGDGARFIRIGTLSKALGGVGGFVAASRDVIDLLVNRARAFIYTTALPPAACEAAREALRIMATEPERRTRLHALARGLRRRLREAGFDIGPTDGTEAAASEDRFPETEAAAGGVPPTPIVPILLGDPERALAMAAALLERGIFCPAVRPPTVPPGTSRLRVSLTAAHTEEDLDALVAALGAARDAL